MLKPAPASIAMWGGSKPAAWNTEITSLSAYLVIWAATHDAPASSLIDVAARNG